MAVLGGRLSNLSPARLGAILNAAEMGDLRDWADLCDRMVEVDATLRASLETRLAAIAGARWLVEPGTPTGDPARDKYAAPAAAFLERVIAGIDHWPTRVMEALDGIPKGIGVLQKTWEWDGHAVIPDLTWVHARRFRWWREDWTLRLIDDGDQLYAPGLELDPDAWIVHAPKTVAGYPTRVGVLRACAWPYLFKRWCQQFWMTGAERFAWPLLWAKVPRGAGPDVRAAAQTGLDDMSADHSAVVEDPVAFQLIETTIKDNGTWKTFIESMNNEIGKAVLGMTDMNEPGRIGSYASVEVRRGTTVDARIAMDELSLAGTMRAQFAEPLLRFNRHLFGGVMPPIPSVRWAIAAKRSPIPSENANDASLNERRRAIDLDPVEGGDEIPNKPKADEGPSATVDVAASAFNGAQVTALQGMLASVKDGTLAPAAAVVAIRVSFPTVTVADATSMVNAQAPAPVAPQVEPATTSVEVGSRWLDTEDSHRLEVVSVADGSVYFLDLDGPNPSRQWRWALRSFLERARPDTTPTDTAA